MRGSRRLLVRVRPTNRETVGAVDNPAFSENGAAIDEALSRVGSTCGSSRDSRRRGMGADLAIGVEPAGADRTNLVDPDRAVGSPENDSGTLGLVIVDPGHFGVIEPDVGSDHFDNRCASPDNSIVSTAMEVCSTVALGCSVSGQSQCTKKGTSGRSNVFRMPICCQHSSTPSGRIRFLARLRPNCCSTGPMSSTARTC